MRVAILFAVLVSMFAYGCDAGDDTSGTGGSTPDLACQSNQDCAAKPETPYCDLSVGDCDVPPIAGALGWGDGSATSVTFTIIHEEDKLRRPVDLEFNPSNPAELWVVNYLDGSAIVITSPGMPEVTWVRKRDPDASHFMNKPPALAFGVVVPTWNQTFGVCGDGNNGGDNFMGPALFSADLSIFAKPTNGLGSHLDMLHSTTFCRGIAHQEASIYWVFNSAKGSLDKYDFHLDHGPGNEDHSDGEIFRYAEGFVAGVEGSVSHLFYRPEDKQLYVADTGNKRIAKLDTTTGMLGNSFSGQEPVKTRKKVLGAVMVDLVPPGVFEAPSGVQVYSDIVYVSDTLQSRFYAFDLSGQLIRTLDTGLPPGSLAGLTFGPDGKVYFVDTLTARVYRIDPV